MLQQTQVDRVIPKYKGFIRAFPNFKQLATSPRSEVLRLWSGLGYNRRALNLHKTAKIVSEKYHGRLPRDKEALLQLPGIGNYTASAVRVFAYNISDVMIETNIRTVFIHYLFINKYIIGAERKVSDTELLPLIAKTLNTKNPRAWYWALMDYGVYIKKTIGNVNVQSRHYTKQPKFEGSNRQLRGNILKTLVQKPVTLAELIKTIKKPEIKIVQTLTELEKEGFIKQKRQRFALV